MVSTKSKASIGFLARDITANSLYPDNKSEGKNSTVRSGFKNQLNYSSNQEFKICPENSMFKSDHGGPLSSADRNDLKANKYNPNQSTRTSQSKK